MTENKTPDNAERSSDGQSKQKQNSMDTPYQPAILQSQVAQGGCLQLFMGFMAFLASLGIAILVAFNLAGTNLKIILTTVMILIVCGSVVVWIWRHLRMFVVGYLIGLGLAALAFGLCYSLMHVHN